MAVFVAEIMNTELFSVHAQEAAGDVVEYLLALAVTAAPVLDADRRPVGFVALSDLVSAPPGTRVESLMTAPADVIPARATIREAAAAMARRSRHHLVCVDVTGRAVGFVSLLDVVRGLIGAPASHPASFPHYDATTGLRWTDPTRLGLGTLDVAPPCAGLLELIEGTPGRPDRVLWSRQVPDVRACLRDLATRPGAAPPAVRHAALAGHLWFRAASLPLTATGKVCCPPRWA